MDTLEHKGFIGSVHFSSEDETFFGKIEGINDLVTFEADSVESLIKSFKKSVDEYIKFCEESNINPLKSVKGSFNVRIPKEDHIKALRFSFYNGYKSLNHYVADAIREKNNKESK